MTEFAVWAPEAARVRLRLRGAADRDMRPAPGGWWRVEVPGVGAGTDYAFLLDDGPALPDPRSAWQPAGVHGPSRLYDHAAFGWTDRGWTGRQLPGSIIYELHVGTFTPEGTFDAAAGRLDHLVDLGVDLVELLPVNAFDGERERGYDGVCWYAPHEPYGGPDGLKRLVDAAHAKGLGVILDVAHHPSGPAGAYAPYLAGQREPRVVNLEGPHSDEVRRHVIDSALAWLRDYHVDGLRLDAVPDTRATPLLEELAVEVESLSTHLGRPLSLIAGSDRSDPTLILPREAGGYGLHAQWNDDAHHALHTLLTGERPGHHADFGSLECLTDVLTGAFFHVDSWSGARNRSHGRPVDRQRIPGHRFVAYLQNHDQVGNRATGDRSSAILPAGLLRVGATLLMTAPFTPMLFMGEEWAASTPWQFVTSHPEPGPATAVATGRRRETTVRGWPPGEAPDPRDRQTFVRSRLDWAELDKPEHREMYDFHRRLIALRKRHPDLSDPRLGRVEVRHGDQFLLMRRGECLVVANLAGKPQRINLPGAVRSVLLATESGVTVMRDGLELPAESAAIVAL